MSTSFQSGKIMMAPFLKEDWFLLGSIAYAELNSQLWQWKSKGLIDSILINPYPQPSHRHIADILGYKNTKDMTENWNEKSTNTLKLLCGPYGYTVYKMLVIKWEDKINHDSGETSD